MACKILIEAKVLKVCKVTARLLGALHLQHLLMLMILGVDNSKQVRLRAYPVSMFGAKKKCFNAAWDWLEYSVKFDAVFCFPCHNFELKAKRDFRRMPCKSIFTTDDHRN